MNRKQERPLRFVGIIPARFASTRFPGKPLADIGGKLMIQRVYEQVSKVIENVYVATDDQRIFEAVESFGGNAVMTSEHHRTGTDRCYEAFTKLDEWFDVIVNIQGDEPFIQPEQILTLKECFQQGDTQIATLVKPLTGKKEDGLIQNPNMVKVVVNKNDEAMYFSRSVIPFVRGTETEDWAGKTVFYKHIGIYAYRTEVLEELTRLSQTPLELAESLEQLRWLENGYRIRVGKTDLETVGIDTPDDLKRVKEMYKF